MRSSSIQPCPQPRRLRSKHNRRCFHPLNLVATGVTTFLDCPGCPSIMREFMSGPNTSYDPVQVTPLDAEHVEAMVAEALAAFAAAGTVAELKQARLAHAGDR